jgi:hypothetical protein
MKELDRRNLISDNAERLLSEFPPQELSRWEKLNLAEMTSLGLLRAQKNTAREKYIELTRTSSLYQILAVVCLSAVVFAGAYLKSPSSFTRGHELILQMILVMSLTILIAIPFKLPRFKKIEQAYKEMEGDAERYSRAAQNFLRYINPLIVVRNDEVILEIKDAKEFLGQLSHLAFIILSYEDDIKRIRADARIPSSTLKQYLDSEDVFRKQFDRLFEINQTLGFGVKKSDVFGKAQETFKVFERASVKDTLGTKDMEVVAAIRETDVPPKPLQS